MQFNLFLFLHIQLCSRLLIGLLSPVSSFFNSILCTTSKLISKQFFDKVSSCSKILDGSPEPEGKGLSSLIGYSKPVAGQYSML